jgi:hypothetical protein
MRAHRLLAAFLVAGGIGCSPRSQPVSQQGAGDKGDAAAGPVDMAAYAPVDLAGGGVVLDMINPAGPWPVADVTFYGAAQGLGAILDANPDDNQNIWAAAQATLYLLRPGTTQFVRFTAADGLHIQGFTDPYGQANQTSITAIAGGHANEVFVGYYGYETLGDPYKDTEAQKELGNGDRVTIGTDGKLSIVRYLFRCDYAFYNGCWENRSPRRILYAHYGIAAGHVFFGFNHGVSHVYNDAFGDHVHPEVWYQPGSLEKVGEFFGLALLPSGDLWMAGRYGVGLQPWMATPHFKWVDGNFKYAFTTDSSDHGLNVPTGYHEDNRGAAVTPDGVLWLARLGGGLVSWNPKSGTYGSIVNYPQVPSDLLDLQADADGTLWLVNTSGSLLRFDPRTGRLSTFGGVSGVTRIYLDTSVAPRAVYASTSGGLAVIRAK